MMLISRLRYLWKSFLRGMHGIVSGRIDMGVDWGQCLL
jgi:hypothetical protein